MTEENVIQISGRIMTRVDLIAKKVMCKKDYLWNPGSCSGENRKHLANIMNNSTITCDEVIVSYDEEINYIFYVIFYVILYVLY